MKKIFWTLLMAVTLLSCNQQKEKGTAREGMVIDSTVPACCAKDGILIHISSGYGNSHKVLMALKMALMMSKDKDVLLYLDIDAVKLVLKDSKDLKFDEFPTLKELLQQLIAAKVMIMACPTCLKIAGKSETDLIPGVVVARKDAFFSFTKGRIVTLDY
ncbi:MAG TPA: DsrE family protein [Bacteroidales bacterium]|nr:DsrE family protein [Bacteroidales bacterium]